VVKIINCVWCCVVVFLSRVAVVVDIVRRLVVAAGRKTLFILFDAITFSVLPSSEAETCCMYAAAWWHVHVWCVVWRWNNTYYYHVTDVCTSAPLHTNKLPRQIIFSIHSTVPNTLRVPQVSTPARL